MKKNKVNSKISITKSVIASLNEVDVRKIFGGETGTTCFQDSNACDISAGLSCYSPCGDPAATRGCNC